MKESACPWKTSTAVSPQHTGLLANLPSPTRGRVRQLQITGAQSVRADTHLSGPAAGRHLIALKSHHCRTRIKALIPMHTKPTGVSCSVLSLTLYFSCLLLFPFPHLPSRFSPVIFLTHQLRSFRQKHILSKVVF